MEWTEIYHRLVANAEDAAAWAALEQRVLAWARAQLWQHGWTVVADAVADTCSTTVLTLERARGAETFGGFVYGHFLNVRRRALRAPATDPIVADPPAAETEAPTSDEIDLLRRCLAELPPRERRAVELRFFQEASSAAIGAELDTSEGNARQLVFRGIAHLRMSASKYWPDGRG